MDRKPHRTGGQRASFWSWYLLSAKSDGRPVSGLRRVLTLAIGWGVIVYWYLWMAHPLVRTLFPKVVGEHPLCASGIVLAFVLMYFRGVILDYMSYNIYQVSRVQPRRGILNSGGKLQSEYEQMYGKDFLCRAPELVAAASVSMIAISGFALVFSR